MSSMCRILQLVRSIRDGFGYKISMNPRANCRPDLRAPIWQALVFEVLLVVETKCIRYVV